MATASDRDSVQIPAAPLTVSAWLAAILAVCVLIDSFWHQDWAALTAGAAVIVYLALELRNMSRPPFILTCVTFVALAAFLGMGWLDRDLMVETSRRGGFLGFFIIAVNSLKEAAQTSPMVQQSGAILVRQPPGKRYAWLSLGGAMIGVLVNMGAVVLLATMVRQSVDNDPDETDQRIRDIRKQRMTIAAMRGFATVTMWSPTAVTIALVVTALPELTWLDIAPLGFAMTMTMMVIGFALDRLAFPRKGRAPISVQHQTLMPLLRVTLLIMTLPIIATGLSRLLTVPPTTALLITFPLVALCWIFAQTLPHGPFQAVRTTLYRARAEMLPSLALARNEVAIFACSGALSVLATSQIDFDALGALLAGVDIGRDWLMIWVAVLMMVLTAVGMNPILSAGILMETVTRVPGLDYSPLALAMTITFTWSLSILTGPMTTTVHLVARLIGVTPFTVAVRWGGVYTVCCLVVFCLTMLVFA